MSGTPRTECYVLNPLPQVVSADFARELERELNAMTRERDEAVASATLHWEKFGASRMAYDAAERRNADLIARIKRLEEFVEQLTNPKFTRDDLPKEALLQRIKRLEEAGDAMMSEPCEYTFELWLKAKEAKL